MTHRRKVIGGRNRLGRNGVGENGLRQNGLAEQDNAGRRQVA